MKINIYLSDLSAYVSGNENGRWISLPMDRTELEAIYNSIVKEEHVILDYNAPFIISEYENIFDLNEKMQALAEADETTIKLLCKYFDTAEEALDALENDSYYIFDIEAETEDWNTSGEEANGIILHEHGFNDVFGEIPDEMFDYINWAQVWQCLSINQGWREICIDDSYYLIRAWS